MYKSYGANFYVLKRGKREKCGADILVNSVTKDVDSKEVCLSVTFPFAKDGENTVDVNYADLKPTLEKYGYCITRENESHVKRYIAQQVDGLQVYEVYCSLGWHKDENENFEFRAFENVVPEERKSEPMREYGGNIDIIPRTFDTEKFCETLKALIENDVELQLAVVIGLSACVVGYLRSYCVIDNPVIDIHGKSSTGKSTCARLAVAMGCNPLGIDSENSLFMSCSSTVNALLGRIVGNNGYPVCFDEISCLDKDNKTILIYQLADGKERARLTKSQNLQETKKWSTTVIFTGEYSLLDDSDLVDGIGVRVTSFDNVMWTKSGQQAKEVDNFSREYYGLGVALAAKDLLKYAHEDVVNLYDEDVQRCLKKIGVADENGLKERKAKHIAIFRLTAALASVAFGFKFSMKGITQLLLEGTNRNDSPIWRRAYEHILSSVEQHKSHFDHSIPENVKAKNGKRKFLASINKDDKWGCVECEMDKNNKFIPSKCVILVKKFKEFLKEGQFKGTTSILTALHEHGLVEKCDDRYAIKQKISGSGANVSCYVLLYDKETSGGIPLHTLSPADRAEVERKQLEEMLTEDKPADFNEEGGGADDST